MDSLKKLWPTPFSIKKGDLGSFLVQLVIFIVICAVGGLIIGLLGKILPILGFVWWIVGGLLDVYGVVGLVLSVLKFIGAV